MTQEQQQPKGFVMTFVKRSPVVGAGVKQIGQMNLPFIPRQGDFYVLPSGDTGVVEQVRFEFKQDGGFGILVILGGLQRNQG